MERPVTAMAVEEGSARLARHQTVRQRRGGTTRWCWSEAGNTIGGREGPANGDGREKPGQASRPKRGSAWHATTDRWGRVADFMSCPKGLELSVG
jgi:hypothetical protein